MKRTKLLCSVKVGAEMAIAMGDSESASQYIEALEKGSKRMDSMLWNGEYYIQKVDNCKSCTG